MIHIPSFLVGSLVSGTSFLLLHREVSHRSRLSSKWLLAEKWEDELQTLWKNAKTTMPIPMNDKMIRESEMKKLVSGSVDKWNEGVEYVRDFVSKK